MSQKEEMKIPAEGLKFRKRLDFYWKFITLYLIILIGYMLLRGVIEEGTLTVHLIDPIVILLALFIAGYSLWLLIQYWKGNMLLITNESLSFRNRFREKTYNLSEIKSISYKSERARSISSSFRVFKIKIASRRRAIRIKPFLFDRGDNLAEVLLEFKRQNKK